MAVLSAVVFLQPTRPMEVAKPQLIERRGVGFQAVGRDDLGVHRLVAQQTAEQPGRCGSVPFPFHNKVKDLAFVILASAAEGILPATEQHSLLDQLTSMASFKEIDYNLFSNWAKHPTGPDEIELPIFEVVMVVVRAISKFIAAYRKQSIEMAEFLEWAKTMGLFPL